MKILTYEASRTEMSNDTVHSTSLYIIYYTIRKDGHIVKTKIGSTYNCIFNSLVLY